MGVFRVGLIVPSSNTTMEVDFHRTLPEGVETATSRMYLEDTTKEGEIRMIEDSLPEAARALRTMKPGLAVFGGGHVVALSPQVEGQHVAHDGFVFDDENGGHRRRL